MHEGLSYLHADETFLSLCVEWKTNFKRQKSLMCYVEERQGPNVKGFEGFCDSRF